MVSSPISWSKRLDHLLNGGVFSHAEATELMEAWLEEGLTPVQTGAFLAAGGHIFAAAKSTSAWQSSASGRTVRDIE